ncbi:MAG: hypothetical protein LKF31_09450 [Muribaculaceae bacterium]|jgi:hypothetical protein|nr:hypothetical protein [Muribaculaceae bacterium]
MGQLGGTVWDSASAWHSTDCNGIFGLVPKVFHLIVHTNLGTIGGTVWDNAIA